MSRSRGGGGRSKVACAKPADPPFIQRIKEQIGWKAGPTIEAKREHLPVEDEDDPEFDEPTDEKPTVVVLKAGDLTADEANEAQKEADLNDRTPGRHKFRKPTKNKASDTETQATTTTTVTITTNTSTSVKRSNESPSSPDESKAKRERSDLEDEKSTKKDHRPQPSRNLLSFGDDEDEED